MVLLTSLLVSAAPDSPLTWPAVSTVISSPFGPRLKASEGFSFDWHRGIDVPGAMGEDIYAIEDGTVDGVFTEGNPNYPDGGNVIRIRHDDADGRYYSLYMHLQDMFVAVNDVVNAGDLIGTMGDSGETGFIHLHFEIRERTSCSLENQNQGGCPVTANGKDPHVNPIRYLFPANATEPVISVPSLSPLTVRVTVPETETDFDSITVVGPFEESYVLAFNERTGYDASTTANLDLQTTAENVTVTPDVFTSTTYLDGTDYGIEFVFNDLNGYQSIQAEDVWGNQGEMTQAPSVLSLSPGDNEGSVGVDEDLTLTFDQYVYPDSGDVEIRKTSDNSLVEAIDVLSGQVTGGGTAAITINPSANLLPGTGYYIQIDNTAFKNLSDINYAGIADTTSWNFTTVTQPTVSSLAPADNVTGVSLGANLVVTFSEAVNVGSGNISLRKTSDNSLVEAIDVASGQVTGGGTTTITINPTTDLLPGTGYYVQIDVTAFDSLLGVSYPGIADTTSWNFTSAPIPTVSTLTPADGASNIALQANLVITFSEAVNVGSGNITIKKSSDDSVVESIAVNSGQVTGGGTSTITINPNVTLLVSTNYYVQIDSTAFEGALGVDYPGIVDNTSWNFSTPSTLAVSSFTPQDGAIGVNLNSHLVIEFNEAVNVDAGNITLRKTSDDSLVEAIDVTSGQVTGGGTAIITIDPTADLEVGEEYYVQIDSTAFKSLLDVYYEGIADTTSWSFTTVTEPLISILTPTDDATGVSLNNNLSITFSEAVNAVSGDITIKKSSDDSLVEAIDVTSGQVTGAGTTTITINPTSNLLPGTGYYVQIDATAFDSLLGVSYAGIADTSSWNFDTLASTPDPTPASTISPAPRGGGGGGGDRPLITNDDKEQFQRGLKEKKALLLEEEKKLPLPVCRSLFESAYDTRYVDESAIKQSLNKIVEKDNFFLKILRNNQADWTTPYILAARSLEWEPFLHKPKNFDQTISRGQFVQLMVDIMGVELISPEATFFPDVPMDHPYVKEIYTAKINGWVKGYNDGHYRPDQVISRVESMVILANVMKLKKVSNNEQTPLIRSFKDVSLISWYSDAIKYGKCYNIIGGEKDGTFQPTRDLLKPEAAKILIHFSYHLGNDL